MGVTYFAYGSNMLTSRLISRVSSAQITGSAYLSGWKVVFNKLSIDGSGKANLIESPTSIAWGVLFDIEKKDFPILDRIEGGYTQIKVTVTRHDGEKKECVTYVSFKFTDDQRAYKSYKEIIIQGARENKLPPAYISYLEQLPERPNNNT